MNEEKELEYLISRIRLFFKDNKINNISTKLDTKSNSLIIYINKNMSWREK